MAFAGVDGVAHDLGPLLLPDLGVVLQAGHEVGHVAALHGLGHRLRIEQVCRDRLIVRVHLAWVATDLPDGVGVLREKLGEFAADGSVGAEDALHGVVEWCTNLLPFIPIHIVRSMNGPMTT